MSTLLGSMDNSNDRPRPINIARASFFCVLLLSVGLAIVHPRLGNHLTHSEHANPPSPPVTCLPNEPSQSCPYFEQRYHKSPIATEVHSSDGSSHADTAAVILNWSRFPNVKRIAALLCAPELRGVVKEVLIWNNNPRALALQVISFVHIPPSPGVRMSLGLWGDPLSGTRPSDSQFSREPVFSRPFPGLLPGGHPVLLYPGNLIVKCPEFTSS